MNKTEPVLVSVITPIYNSEKYIGDAIKSVQNQTYTNWEMLIVDDCSTDNSEIVIQSYLNDCRIQYFHLTENMGGARARNRALEDAKGRIIAFLDADDQWKPDKLKKQLEFMLKNKYGFTFTGYDILKKTNNKCIHVPQKVSYTDFMKNTIIGTLTVMIDRNIVGNINMVDVKKDHDSMTWAKILRKGNIAYGLDESLSLYRKVSGSISNNKFKAVKNHWQNCRKIDKIPFLKCCYYFLFYIANAIKKHYC